MFSFVISCFKENDGVTCTHRDRLIEKENTQNWFVYLTSVFVQIENHTFCKAGPPVSKGKR